MSSLGRLDIAPLTQGEAEAIAGWSYAPPYDFYNAGADEHDLAELRDPSQRGVSYFAARDAEGHLIGFFQLEREGDVVDVGLGLRPDLTSKGLGREFLEAGLAFASVTFSPRVFTLRVAAFNTRAITVYERAGFGRVRTFEHETNGGLFSFVQMERPA